VGGGFAMGWNSLGTVRWAVLFAFAGASALAQEPAPSPSSAPPPPRRGGSDQRRTVRSYPANLAYNVLGVVTPGNYAVLGAGVVLTAPMFLLDDEVEGYFARHPHDEWGDIGATAGGTLAVTGLTLGLFSAGRIARGDRFRAMTYDMSQAVIVNFTYTAALKTIAHRERPDQSDHRSFPSGHASNAFACATVVARHYGDGLGIPAYFVATLIAGSRLAGDRHFLSDVVAGAVFGYGVGRAVYRRNSRPPEEGAVDPGHVRFLAPDAGPSGDGLGLRLTVRF
jgi:membrane-associated phospholipid phosphatase